MCMKGSDAKDAGETELGRWEGGKGGVLEAEREEFISLERPRA